MIIKILPWRATVCAVFIVCSGLPLLAAIPQFNSSSLRGLQIGQKTTVTVSGSNLAANPRLYAPIRFEQKATEVSDNSVTFDVWIDENASPNIYPFRVVTNHGLSNPQMIGVDAMPQIMLSEKVESLPVAMTGNLSGQEIRTVDVDLRKGQTITVEVEGKRLGSQLRPVVRAFDPAGRQLAWAKQSRMLAGDGQLRFQAKQDGTHRVQLHDQLYKGPTPGFFRLKIGEFPAAAFAYPLGERAITLIPHWSSRVTKSNLIPIIYRSVGEEFTETSFDQNKTGRLPLGVTGRIESKGEIDVYNMEVEPESTVRFRVWSHRFGTPLDCRLRILDEQGKQIGEGDDHDRSLDPMSEVKIPKGVKKVRVEVSGQAGSFGKETIYRLEVENVSQPTAVVKADVNHLTIPSGQQVVIPFQVDRKGDKRPISVQSNGSELLMSSSNCVIKGSETRGLMEISAPSYTQAVFPIRFVAMAGRESSLVQLPSANSNVSFPNNYDLVAAVVPESPILVRWDSDPFKTSFLGGRFQGKVNVTTSDDRKVELSLITSQVRPGDKEVAAKQIRIENVKNEGSEYEFEIFVPAGFPVTGARAWSYAIRADAKSKDGKQVIASAYTRLRSSLAKEGLQLAIESPIEQKLTIGEQAEIQINGKISQLPEIGQPVTVQLLGMPDGAGIKANSAVVHPGNEKFSLYVNFADVKKEMKFDKLYLRASFDSKDPTVRDIRRDVGIKVELKSPKKE